MSNYDHVKKSRQTQKSRIIRAMGGKCALCGYNKSNSALECHHIIATEKSFSISTNCNKGWEDIKTELPKCILLCANCHREVHDNISAFKLTTTYDAQIADEISLEIQIIKGEIKNDTKCVCCGATITRGAKMCVECANKHRRRVEDRPSGNELARLVAIHGFLGVGKMYGVTDNAVRKWCKTDGLPTYKQDIIEYVKILDSNSI